MLKLNNNNLQQVPELSIFPHLQTLDLSYNKISALSAGVFKSLPQLLHLNISFNALVLSTVSVDARALEGLHNLKTLR